jgi:hypothetical protein
VPRTDRHTRCCDDRLNPPSTSRSNTPSASPTPALNHPWAAWATAATTLWPRPSTASTRPRSSIDAGRGARSRPSSSRPWNGSTGSTIAGRWSLSATYRRPKPGLLPRYVGSSSNGRMTQTKPPPTNPAWFKPVWPPAGPAVPVPYPTRRDRIRIRIVGKPRDRV